MQKGQIHFEGKPPECLSELFFRFFILREDTYNRKNDKQCESNRSRSRRDFTKLCAHYIPKLAVDNIKTIVKLVTIDGDEYDGSVDPDTANKLLWSGYCDDVKRVVHDPCKLGIHHSHVQKVFEYHKIQNIRCKTNEKKLILEGKSA